MNTQHNLTSDISVALLSSQHPSLLNQDRDFNDPNMPSSIPIEDPKVIQRLVHNLMYLFNITPGDYLTFILGQGHCTQNEDALKYWVMDQLTDEPVSQDDVQNYLEENLKQQLTMEVFS
jgi:hypothetical protein